TRKLRPGSEIARLSAERQRNPHDCPRVFRAACAQEDTMAGLKIHNGEWVVVCDGGKALILENAGDAVFPDLRTREIYEPKPAANHQADNDEPGRVFASTGSRR